jgi:hypothetical protein
MHPIIEFSQHLGVTLYPGQEAALTAYYESGKPNWLLLSGRRGGKSLLSDVIACYEATVPDYSAMTRPGEDRYILIVSVRDDSAKIHIRQIGKLLRHGKNTRALIDQIKEDRILLKNDTVILSLPASARAARGYTASTLILDEAAFFVDTLGNSSAEAIYQALSPTVATFGDAARIVITTSVNARSGLVYDLYENAEAGQLDDWHVTKTDSRSLNPKVSQRIIDNALKRDPEGAAAEYLSEFREQVEAFLSSEAVDKCIDVGLSRGVPVPGTRYVMAIDPALMRDNYAFLIAHQQDGLVTVDYINRLTAPVNANGAEDLLKSLNARWRPTSILCDNPSTVQRLKDLPMVYTPFTRQQKMRIYGALKEAVNLGLVAFPNDNDLISELKALQIRGGVDIAAPKSGRVTHDDLADTLAMCVDNLQGTTISTVSFIPSLYSDLLGLDEPDGYARAASLKISPDRTWLQAADNVQQGSE